MRNNTEQSFFIFEGIKVKEEEVSFEVNSFFMYYSICYCADNSKVSGRDTIWINSINRKLTGMLIQFPRQYNRILKPFFLPIKVK